MRKQTLLVLVGVMCCGRSVLAAAVALDDKPLWGVQQTNVRSAGDAISPDSDVVIDWRGEPAVSPDVQVGELEPNTYFEHVVVGADGVAMVVVAEGSTAGLDETLIYSNTLGINTASFGANALVSDDLTTIAPVGCNLARYRFKVLGRFNPTGTGGPYTVRFSLYNVCPQTATSTQRAHYTDESSPNTGIRIRGTDGEITFPDDAPRTIEKIVTLPAVATLPTNLWIGVSFTRSNCGVVLGAPAMVGHSADSYDFPGFSCNSNFGGFPQQPHASYWVEMFGGTNCSASFVGYKAAKASGAPFSAGSNALFFDDVKLIVDNCQMIGYEVAVKGQAFYTFDLRRFCTDNDPIPGTARNFTVSLSTQPQLQLARFTFDPPIQLTSPDIFFRFTVNNTTAGVIMAGVQPTIGRSTENYFLKDALGACITVPPLPGSPIAGNFNASITCRGSQPIGACCDPFLTQCAGGADEGKRCPCESLCQGGTNNGKCCNSSANCPSGGVCVPFCAAPGTCNAVCREVPKINCPFPPGDLNLRPPWQLGSACVPEPFGNSPCGLAACCHVTLNPNTHNLDEVCDDMTRSECNAAPPLDKLRLWELGEYCGIGSQICPRNACLGRTGSCTAAHLTPGCSDPFCCTIVCENNGPEGAYCCDVEWDSVCVTFAELQCTTPPGNDQCAPDSRFEGALTIPVPGSVASNNNNATDTPDEPGFCCHGGVSSCVGGTRPGAPCVVQQDCPDTPGHGDDGFCPDITSPMPGAKGTHAIWFKFLQPPGVTSTSINTCSSNSPANDSIVQVFSAGDNSSIEKACRTLSVIGCNDDASGCASGGRNSKLCVKNLVPGQTYYIMVAAKTENSLGQYRVTLSPGTCSGGDATANDYCPNAATITDGVTPFFINDTCIGGTRAGLPCETNADCSGGGSCPTGQHTVTFDCPSAPCAANGLNDVWYNYRATCSGTARFETCGASTQTTPNTTLVVYDDCTKCPPVSDIPLGCNDDAFQNCGTGSRVAVVGVQQGQCLKVRLTDSQGFPVAGNLTVSCTTNDCQPNGIPDDVEIAECPANNPDCHDCNGNGIPDFCDIRDLFDTDCNNNHIPDACELATRDCQPNGIPDDCDIANCPPADPTCKDLNGDGKPDSCPVACPSGSLTASVPAKCAIDARQPHAPGNPAALQGWNSVALTFAAGCTVTGATTSDFSVRTVPAVATPTVSNVGVAGQVVTVTLSSVIPAQAWTCIKHIPSGDEVCLGSLPADANGDRTAAPVDILDIIDNLNGVRVPPLAIHQCDIDRSNLCAPPDILSEIDLLNGASGFIVWNGKTISVVCPSP